jgi:hypothetical protein
MYRGTTPTITLRIETELEFSKIKQVWFTISTVAISNRTITKTITDLSLDADNKTISCTLTQEESLSLPEGNVEIQARILVDDGKAFATPISKLPVEKILEGGVIYE